MADSSFSRLWRGIQSSFERGRFAGRLILGLVGLAGGFVAFWSFAADSVSILTPFGKRDLRPELTPMVESLVRNVGDEHPRPGPGREAALNMALEAFADSHRVRPEEARQLAAQIARRIDLANESIARGLDLARGGQFELASREFAAASTTDPNNPAAWSNLAASQSLLSRHDEARLAYERAMLLSPNDWRIRYNLGLLFVRSGAPQQGMHHIASALASLREERDSRVSVNEILEELASDPGLQPLRELTGYAELVADLR